VDLDDEMSFSVLFTFTGARYTAIKLCKPYDTKLSEQQTFAALCSPYAQNFTHYALEHCLKIHLLYSILCSYYDPLEA